MNQPRMVGGSVVLFLLLCGTVWGQPNQQDRVDRLNAQISTLAAKGNFAAVVPLQQEVVAIYRSVLGEQNADTAAEIDYLGRAYLQAGNFAEAKQLLLRVYGIRRNIYGDNHAVVGISLLNLGWASQELGEFEGAERYYEGSRAILTAQLGAEHAGVALSKRSTTPCATGIFPVPGLAILGQVPLRCCGTYLTPIIARFKSWGHSARAIPFPARSQPYCSKHRVAW